MATSLLGDAFNRYVPGEKSPDADASLASIGNNLDNASAPAEISRQAASNVNETMKSSNLVGGAFLPAVSTQETGVAETPTTTQPVSTSQTEKKEGASQQEGLLSRILSGIKGLVTSRNLSVTGTKQNEATPVPSQLMGLLSRMLSGVKEKITPSEAIVGSAFTPEKESTALPVSEPSQKSVERGPAFAGIEQIAKDNQPTNLEDRPTDLMSDLLINVKQQMEGAPASASALRNTVGETKEVSSQETTAPVSSSSSPTAKTPENMQSAGLLSRILSGIKNRFAPPVGLPTSAPTDTTGASKQENTGPSPATVTSGFVNLMGWILNGVRAKFKAPVGAPPSVNSMTTDRTTTNAGSKAVETSSTKENNKETISNQTLRSVLSILEHKTENTKGGNDAAAEVFEEGLSSLRSVATDILREVKEGTPSLSGGERTAAARSETAAESKSPTAYIPNQNDAANFAMSQAKGINAAVPTKQQPTELYKPPVMLPDSDVTLVSGPTKDPNQTTFHTLVDDNRTTLHTGPTPDQNQTTLHVPQEPVMMELDPLANKMADAISGLKNAVGGTVVAGGKSFDSTDKGTANKDDSTNPFGLSNFLGALRDRVAPTAFGQGLGQVKDATMSVPFSQGEETSNAGDIIGGMGNIAGTIMGGPVAALGKLGEVALGSVGKLQDWTKGLHDANMQFAEFSASMAEVQAEQTVRDIELSRERGERRAESAKYLAEGMSELNSTTAPIADLFANAKNYIGGALSQVTSTLLKPLSLIAKLLQKDSDKGDKSEINMGEWLAEMGKKGYFETYGTLDRSPFDLGDPRNR